MGCNATKDLNPNAARGYLLENFSRHRGGINCMSVNEDKTMLVTGGEDYTAKLWTVDPVAYLGTLEGHSGYVLCCVFHGIYVFTGSADKTVRKWNVKNRQCIFIYEGHEMTVTRIVCTPCEILISTSQDGTARAWDALADSGTVIKKACLQVFKGHLKSIYSIIFIPDEENPLMGKTIYDGDIVITGSTDFTARSWSLKTGEKLKIFGSHRKNKHKGPVNCMAVDGEAKKLFTGSADSTIKCWDIETAECLRELKGHTAAVMHLLVHNRILYSAGVDKLAMAWIIEIGEISKIYHGNGETISCLKYHNGYVYTACTQVRMYKAKTKECKRVFKGHSQTITAMEVTEDKLFTVSSDGSLRIWDTTGVLDEDVTYEEQLSAIEAKENGMQPLQKPPNENDSRLEDFA
ncbi:WD repeat-containing protein 86-like [Centruroides sculpturatus]|uniref:WD repeat-containing protein 86-like n=1 Tax=Centruroides sculpturatus TaxID=218467 RepID=UPI000C6CD394|nr:WD repeat-containing protein 86-like [Centruroides sculpturatus]